VGVTVIRVELWRCPVEQAPSALLPLAEMNHGVVQLLVRHRRLGERMGPLSPVGIEHEVEGSAARRWAPWCGWRR